jgi:hypothetical protein
MRLKAEKTKVCTRNLNSRDKKEGTMVRYIWEVILPEISILTYEWEKAGSDSWEFLAKGR